MKKGFTLIELLAVIVILAIIALIATPTILGVVEDARKGAAESSILGYVDAIEKQSMINEMDETKTPISGVKTIEQLGTAGVAVKGQKPTAAYTWNKSSQTVCYSAEGVTVTNGEVQDTLFVYGENKYVVKYDKSTGKAEAVSYSAPSACSGS